MPHDLPPLDRHIIDAVHRDLLVRTELKPADLLFVFGTRHGVGPFLAVIEDLWRKGLFARALVTEGATAGEARTEAKVLADGMMAFGVPEAQIILEERATNTGENVVYSLPLIESRIGLANVRSLIAVGKYFTSARYLMTLQRHWPSVEKMLAPVHYHSHPPEDWHRLAESRAKVLREWRKLEVYTREGFITPWPDRAEA
jgi:uncharacterized SAM-binding protein YcdF (DUF218 family)